MRREEEWGGGEGELKGRWCVGGGGGDGGREWLVCDVMMEVGGTGNVEWEFGVLMYDICTYVRM